MTIENKDRKILRRVFGQVDLPKFIRDYYNWLVDDLNAILSNFSLTRNFDTQYIQGVEIAAGATARIEHRLRVIPAYKLVVHQSGGGLITDGDYAEKHIELTNTGGSTATISLIIFKE